MISHSGNTNQRIHMDEQYRSRDFYLCGYLLSTGHQLQSHSRDNGITTFIFKDTSTLQSAMVNPVEYGQSLRSLKSIIHSTPNHTNTDANPDQKGLI